MDFIIDSHFRVWFGMCGRTIELLTFSKTGLATELGTKFLDIHYLDTLLQSR